MTWVHACPMGGGAELAVRGPVVIASLYPSLPVREEMGRVGEPPTRLTVRLLVDTGACGSALLVSRLRVVGASVSVRRREFVSVNHQTFTASIYRASLDVGFEWGRAPKLRSLPVDFAGLRDPDFEVAHDGVLGRDFLRAFDLFYRGPTGLFELRSDEA